MKFWKKAPPPYWADIRAWSLLVPAGAATLGAIAYSIQGIAVSQGSVLSGQWMNAVVIFGAIMLGIGCEGGTLAASIEIARKRRDGDADLITVLGREISADMAGLLISYTATVFSRVLALHPVQSLPVIIILVLASAADAYFLFKESGDYLSIRDRNVARWETARWYYEEMHNVQAALFALAHDEPMTISDDVKKLKEHTEELKTALQEANKAEEQLTQQLHNTQQEAASYKQQTQQLQEQLVALLERVAQLTQPTQPETQLENTSVVSETQPTQPETQPAQHKSQPTNTTKEQRVVQLLNEGHSTSETAQLAECSYEYARQIKKQLEAQHGTTG